MSEHPTPQQQPTLLPPSPSGAVSASGVKGQGAVSASGAMRPQTARWIPFSERTPDHGQWYFRALQEPYCLHQDCGYSMFYAKDGNYSLLGEQDLPYYRTLEDLMARTKYMYWCPAPPPLPVITS